MSSERRIDVSSVQVAASVMAAVTGALAASFLGVAGTIIGTAMMSVAGTVGVALYRYFLDRSREKIRAASAKVPASAHGSSVPAAAGRHHQVIPSSGTQLGSGAHRADDTETQALPALGGTWSDWPDDTRTRDSASVTGKRGPGRHATGQHGSGQRNGGRADAVNALSLGSFSWQDFSAWLRSSTRHGRARWKNLAGAVLIVFVLAIACITLIEVLAGKPLAAVVSNQPGTGTSISHVVGGSNSAPAHSRSRTPGSGSSTSPASGHSATSSPSTSGPASSSASPVPSATDSPAHSPSPTVSASATPAASPSPHT